MNGKKKLDSLTSLKGLFILIIVFHNTMLLTPLFSSVPGTMFVKLFGGALGNSMFFILSGFLTAYSYREPIGAKRVAFQDFFLKRLKKLYPLFLISNIAALVIAVAQYGVSAINLHKIAFTFLLQIGGGLDSGNPYNSPTWFVSALFVCYIVYFLIAFCSKNTTQYSCAIVMGIAWGYTLLSTEFSAPFCYDENGSAFMNFFIGCGCAELYPVIVRKNKKWMEAAALAALLAAVLLPLRYGVEIICGNVAVAFSFVICPLVLYLALAGGVCDKILRFRPFVYLGEMSMSVFYWHLVVYNAFILVFGWVMPDTAIRERHYIVYVVLMMLVSFASYKLSAKKAQRPRSTLK